MSCRLGKLTPQHLHRRATPESAPAREAAAEAALRRDGRRTAAGRTMSRPRARLRPKTARHGARRRAPATQHSTAHRGHRPQRRVRVGRVRGRACAALRRGPTHLVVALPLSASTWPTQPSRSRGHTPQSGARMRPRGHDAREHTACGPPSATRPPPAARRARGPGSGTESGAARPRAPWACEDEGEGEAEADVSVKEGSG